MLDESVQGHEPALICQTLGIEEIDRGHINFRFGYAQPDIGYSKNGSHFDLGTQNKTRLERSAQR